MPLISNPNLELPSWATNIVNPFNGNVALGLYGAYKDFKNDNESESILGNMMENASGISEQQLMQYLQDTMNSSAEQAELNRAFNKAEAEISRNFQASENQKNRDFTEQMANTSYVRAVKDLQAAGLNPILAYQQGGASSPSASSSVTASQASYNVGSGDSISDVVNALANLVSSASGIGSIIKALK